jgi:hypothetical protein
MHFIVHSSGMHVYMKLHRGAAAMMVESGQPARPDEPGG